jgi:hypothetical protein
MPRLIATEGAVPGMERCRRFLAKKSRHAAIRAAKVIDEKLHVSEMAPDIKCPFEGCLDIRELLIPFGASGYMVPYQHGKANDAVYILAFRHRREEGRR